MELVQVVRGATGKRKNQWINANYPSKLVNRFHQTREKQYVPPPFLELPCDLTPVEVDQFFREQRVDELARKLRANALELGDLDIRDPSPSPTYDETGARTNSRETLVRRSMELEFARINRFLAKKIPGYLPPSDLGKAVKVVRKIQIPDEEDGVNFVAVIVGPRGINHKRLQEESRCRIEIRGRNSSSPTQSYEESQMPQHVHIEGDSDEEVERAVGLVTPLLDPSSKEFRLSRAMGAEAMAVISGHQMPRCAICQGVGHSAAMCPDRTDKEAFPGNDIRCEICGGKGHLSRDCLAPAGGKSTSAASTAEAGVYVPSTMIGAFIGQAGSNIKRLMIETGCNIQVDQSGVARGLLECPLLFHGPPDALVKARQTCAEWIENHRNARMEKNHPINGMTASGGFTDSDAAAAAVQMAYMQQMYWQAWAAQYQQQ